MGPPSFPAKGGRPVWTLGPFCRDNRVLNWRVLIPKLMYNGLSLLCTFTTDLQFSFQLAIESGSTLRIIRFYSHVPGRQGSEPVSSGSLCGQVGSDCSLVDHTPSPFLSPLYLSSGSIGTPANLCRPIPPLPSTSLSPATPGEGHCRAQPIHLPIPMPPTRENGDRWPLPSVRS